MEKNDVIKSGQMGMVMMGILNEPRTFPFIADY